MRSRTAAWSLWVLIKAFDATSLDLSEVRWSWYVLTSGRGGEGDDATGPSLAVAASRSHSRRFSR